MIATPSVPKGACDVGGSLCQSLMLQPCALTLCQSRKLIYIKRDNRDPRYTIAQRHSLWADGSHHTHL
jgi:hypothetical protein